MNRQGSDFICGKIMIRLIHNLYKSASDCGENIFLGERRKVNGHQVDDHAKMDGLESKQTSTFVSRGVIQT